MSVLSVVPYFAGHHPYLWLELDLQVDGQTLPDSCNKASLRALVASSGEPGTHFIFTCSCGDPGCGGFVNGIEVAYEGERIIWTDGDWRYSFVFDARQYRAEIERAMELSAALLDAVIDERVVVDGWDRLLFPEWNEGTQEIGAGDSVFQRRKGSAGLPGEYGVALAYYRGCALLSWYAVRGVYRRFRHG